MQDALALNLVRHVPGLAPSCRSEKWGDLSRLAHENVLIRGLGEAISMCEHEPLKDLWRIARFWMAPLHDQPEFVKMDRRVSHVKRRVKQLSLHLMRVVAPRYVLHDTIRNGAMSYVRPPIDQQPPFMVAHNDTLICTRDFKKGDCLSCVPMSSVDGFHGDAYRDVPGVFDVETLDNYFHSIDTALLDDALAPEMYSVYSWQLCVRMMTRTP